MIACYWTINTKVAEVEKTPKKTKKKKKPPQQEQDI